MTDRTLISIVRGDEDWRQVLRLGIDVRMIGSECEIHEPAGIEIAVPTSADIALGFLRHWAVGSTLHDWARIVLGVNSIDLNALEEGTDGEILLEALWAAAAEETLSDGVIDVIRRTAGST